MRAETEDFNVTLALDHIIMVISRHAGGFQCSEASALERAQGV